MSNNYLKVGKLYSLTSSTDVSIDGASFVLGINNNHTNSIIVTIDGIAFSLSKDITVTFPAPIPFSKVKINSGSAVIFYS
jgi:hypothetical protein